MTPMLCLECHAPLRIEGSRRGPWRLMACACGRRVLVKRRRRKSRKSRELRTP